ncbi:MAG: T9SS type A sorting domain-containing protein [bacterium]
MKKLLYTFHVMAMILLSTLFVQSQTTDTLSMGPGYGNDIFYSMENGEVASAPRDNWDIAFYTPRFSAGIIVNEGYGGMQGYTTLYTYPYGDTSAWESVDTSNMALWKPLYNSPEYWEEGAFNRNSTGHPDYGWGWYNMVNHHLYYEDRRFIYYSLVNDEVVDREPDSQSWDIVFTRYFEELEAEGEIVPYLVAGAASNVDIGANNFHPVSLDFMDWSSEPFDSLKNTIGHDWKSFDFTTGWVILDSNVYFVQNFDGNVYKLIFTWWDGSTTGDFALEKQLVSLVDVDEFEQEVAEIEVYPNPATTQFNIRGKVDYKEPLTVSVYDQSGRRVHAFDTDAMELERGILVNRADFSTGLYIIQITGDNFTARQKLMIR